MRDKRTPTDVCGEAISDRDSVPTFVLEYNYFVLGSDTGTVPEF